MTANSLDHHRFEAGHRYLHDALLGLAVAVVFVIPATLGVFAFL